MSRFTELDILEDYLREHDYIVKRFDQPEIRDYNGHIVSSDRHQVVVYAVDGHIEWDAICQRGSMGYRDGLLEIMGTIVRTGDPHKPVEGWLKAKDIIARLKGDVV